MDRGTAGPGDRVIAGSGNRGGVERLVVWLVVLAVVVGIVGSVWYVAGDLRRDVPDTELAVSFDADSGTITVRHPGGDSIRDRGTERVVIVVTDESENATVQVTWAGERVNFSKRGAGFPIRQGDTLRIDDPTVDADGDGNYHDGDRSVGIHLEPGDSLRVVWRGSRRTGSAKTVILANATLGGHTDRQND